MPEVQGLLVHRVDPIGFLIGLQVVFLVFEIALQSFLHVGVVRHYRVVTHRFVLGRFILRRNIRF